MTALYPKNQALISLVHHMTLICFLLHETLSLNAQFTVTLFLLTSQLAEGSNSVKHHSLSRGAWLTNEFSRIYHVMH